MGRIFLLIVVSFLSLPLVLPGQEKKPAESVDTKVEVKEVTADDAIRNRIVGIFNEVEEFKGIDVTVRSGVVTLAGKVPNTRTREEAIGLVKRTDGVVLTVDRLEEPQEVTAQLSPAMQKMREIGRKIATKLPLFLVAAATVAFFWWLGHFVGKQRRWFEKLHMPSLGRELTRRLLRLVLTVCGIVLALELLDATAIVGAVLGAAGLAGLAIGFAFKNIVENYLAGILLSTRNPFEIGDFIEVGGDIGKVAILTSRDTVLVTLDGNHLRIPNSVVMNSKLLNYTRNPLRRFDFRVGVSCDCDLNDARDLAFKALKMNPGVLQDRKPIVIVESLGDSSVVLRIFAWLDQTKHDFLKTQSESIRLVKETFDQEGIEMPEPIYRVLTREVATAASESEWDEDAVSLPSYEHRDKVDEVSEEDLETDRSIDEEIAKEQRISKEKNLLEEKPAEGDEETR